MGEEKKKNRDKQNANLLTPQEVNSRLTPEEMKKKMGDSRRGEKSHVLKALICIDNNVLYKGVILAAENTGINKNCIALCCRGERKSAGGFRWRYIYDTTKKDGTIIPGAITLGLISESDALAQLTQQND
jgi:hypothetical protein